MKVKTVKMGRPAMPKSKVKDVLIGARFSGDESKRVHDAVKRSKHSKSEWVRNTLLQAAGNA